MSGLKKYFSRHLTNRSGVAALMAVIMAVVILILVASNFWVETSQKQAGSVLTYSSANAYFLAETGIRYAEFCLTSPSDANCPCFAVNGCASDAALGTVTMNKTFGDGRGSFTVTFDVSALPDVRMNSTGKFVEAERFISRLFCQGGGSCPLATNSYTTCTPIIFVNNASTSQANVDEMFRSERVRALLGRMSSREREILELRFGLKDGEIHTLNEEAKRFNITRERVRQIEMAALKKLRVLATSQR